MQLIFVVNSNLSVANITIFSQLISEVVKIVFQPFTKTLIPIFYLKILCHFCLNLRIPYILYILLIYILPHFQYSAEYKKSVLRNLFS